jgi:serine/threonine protein kinase
MPLERQVWIARQMTAALSYMHATEIVHNDIKSLNVLVRLTDFQKLNIQIDLLSLS